MNITEINRPNTIALREQINMALKSTMAHFGLKADAGNAVMDRDGRSVTFKLRIDMLNPDGTVTPPEVSAWEGFVSLNQHSCWPELAIGQTSTDGRYRFAGYKASARVRPFLIDSIDKPGRRYRAESDVIRAMFNLK